MSNKIFIFTSDELTDEMVNSRQEAVLEENFPDYVFIVAEKDGGFICNEQNTAMIVQEYL